MKTYSHMTLVREMELSNIRRTVSDPTNELGNSKPDRHFPCPNYETFPRLASPLVILSKPGNKFAAMTLHLTKLCRSNPYFHRACSTCAQPSSTTRVKNYSKCGNGSKAIAASTPKLSAKSKRT